MTDTETQPKGLSAFSITSTTLDRVMPDDNALRDKVEKGKQKYKDLKTSLVKDGILSALLVRPAPEEYVEQGIDYILVNGLHRTTALLEVCEEQGMDPSEVTIPIQVMEPKSQLQVRICMLAANEQVITTKTSDIRNHLLGIIELGRKEGKHFTQAELGNLISREASYVSKVLSLGNLSEEVMERLDQKKMPLINAYNLGRLPEDEVDSFADRAETMAADEFGALITSHLADLRKNNRKQSSEQFVAIPKVRGKRELIQIYERFEEDHANNLDDDFIAQRNEELQQEGLTSDFILGQMHGLQIALSIDPETIAHKKAQHEAEVAERARAKAERERERLNAKAVADGVGLVETKSRNNIGFS